ncbi:ABC transporter permease subunit [Ectothiorhodospiraceae bacterium BW-2]|nr:ABC transporter permease subunit [Ectothiorhodospiraceae bacterium BW-2]
MTIDWTTLQQITFNHLALITTTTLLSSIIGVGLALLVHRYRPPEAIHYLLLLPVALPSFVVAYLLQSQFGTHSWLTPLAYTLTLYPVIYLPTRLLLQRNNPTLAEVAEQLQLSPIKRWQLLTWPKLKLALLQGIALIIAVVLSDYATPTLTGTPTLATTLAASWLSERPLSLLLPPALILLLIALLLLWSLRTLLSHQPLQRLASHATPQSETPVPLPFRLIAMVILLLLIAWGLSHPLPPLMPSLLPLLLHSAAPVVVMLIVLTLTALISLSRIRAPQTQLTRYIPPVVGLPHLFVALLLASLSQPILDLAERLSGAPPSLLLQVGLIWMAILGSYLLLYYRHLQQKVNTLLYQNLPIDPLTASAIIGVSPLLLLWRLYLPAVALPLLTITSVGAILLFRELTLSYLLLPPDWPTLATYSFSLMLSDEPSQLFWPIVMQLGAGLLLLPLLAPLFRILHR